ncbi:C-C motif chemokine 21 [Crotalus adamanteus]|uniref:C-C motif chemokine 21 n=1 Tax=Crotalus adamanteus TaxID=8729 RepID=A0AAW1C2T2_CROAD
MILAPRLALCLLVAGLCLFQAQGMTSSWDCCLSTKDTPLSLYRLPIFKGYEIQNFDKGCSIKAFVLITRRDRKLCYPLDSKVARDFKKALDEKKARNGIKVLRKRRPSS